MGKSAEMCGREALAHFRDHEMSIRRLEWADGIENLRQRRAADPFMDDVEQAVLLRCVEDPEEAAVADGGGELCGRDDRRGPIMVGREHGYAHLASEQFIDGAPLLDLGAINDALLEPVASGEPLAHCDGDGLHASVFRASVLSRAMHSHAGAAARVTGSDGTDAKPPRA